MYATQQDIEDRYGVDALLIVADANMDDQVDSQKVTKALSDAADEINLYVGKRYPLPLDTVPSVLTRLAMDMGLYFLSAEDGYTEEKRQRYEDAIKVLRSIAKGEVSLGIETEQSEDASPVAMEVEMSSETRIFNRNNNNRIF